MSFKPNQNSKPACAAFFGAMREKFAGAAGGTETG
jgi:hypothetical protein